MIELAQHIEALLLENDCVIVPNFGGFVDGNRGDNPFFTLINRVTTFPQGGTPMRILKRAFRVQAKAMENNIKRILSKRGRNF